MNFPGSSVTEGRAGLGHLLPTGPTLTMALTGQAKDAALWGTKGSPDF